MIYQNQLQFNLDVPSMPSNLVAHYRNPGPLVIEKLGGSPKTKLNVGSREPTDPPVKLTAVSEDQLSMAVRLAKLDLKKMLAENHSPNFKEQDEEQNQLKKTKPKRDSHRNKQRKPQDTNVRLIERYTNPNETRQSVKTQTPRTKKRNAKVNAYGLVLNAQSKWSGAGRGRPDTSPPKDVALSPDSKQAQEIRRLRSELKTYMTKVEELSVQASQQRQEIAKRRDEKDEDEDPRKAARAAEHASRSARLLYSLQQQVREIQEELDRLGPGKVRHTKKSRALNRLAAAHRGAVRALQSFIHHLPSEMGSSSSGLPPHYQELALLIRQLSLCCSQLDVEASGIPEGVLNILEQAKDFHNALSNQVPSSLRPISRPPSALQPDPTTRRRLAFEGDIIKVPDGRPKTSRPKTKTLDSQVAAPEHYRVRETPVRDTVKHRDTPHTTPGPTTVERLRKTIVNSKATPGSPERNEALRAGLEALLRAPRPGHAHRPGHAPRPNHFTSATSRTEKPASAVPQPSIRIRNRTSGRGPTAKSLILPANLKAARERLQRAKAIPRDAHFTQDTVASKLKHRDPTGHSDGDIRSKPLDSDEAVTSAKPVWTPPGSPRSFHKVSPKSWNVAASSEDEDEAEQDTKQSPRRRKVMFDDETKDANNERGIGESRLDSGVMEREIARQAWLDKQAARQMKHFDHTSGANGYPPVPPQWLEEAEKALTNRLQPLIDKVETAVKEQDIHENTKSQSLGQQLSKRGMQATSSNADLLSDLLLEDILADTALELLHIENNDKLEYQAKQLQDAPTVGGMLQSLEQMELVEDEIRRRWKQVEYINQDEVKGESIQQKEGRWMMGTPLDGEFLERFPGDLPTSHTSMEFTKSHQREGLRSNSLVYKHSNQGQTIQQSEDDLVHFSDAESYHNTRIRQSQDKDLERIPTDRTHLPKDDVKTSANHSSGMTRDRPHHLNILQNLLGAETSSRHGQIPSHSMTLRPPGDSASRPTLDRPTLDRPKFSLFIPSDTMNRIRDYRGRFDRHLKKTSHWAYGTFDPWKLAEEVTDEIISEIIHDVSSEVGDILNHCVDDLYKAEFDLT